MYSAVIIDDEEDGINVLVHFLRDFTSLKVKVTGTASNLDEGIQIIKNTNPDIVFLDIDMPGKNGMAIYNYFDEPTFKIVFVTAYQQYAIGALNHYVKQPDGRFMWEGPETTIYGHHTILGQTAAWWARSSGAINQVNVEFDVILGARLIYSAASAAVSEAGANKGVTVIGEGMGRVEAAASKIPGSVILNDMPAFTGNVEQVTSQMMQYNRQWMLDQLRSGNTIIDIGIDINRAQPSIFYQMEQNMIKNYRFLHP